MVMNPLEQYLAMLLGGNGKTPPGTQVGPTIANQPVNSIQDGYINKTNGQRLADKFGLQPNEAKTPQQQQQELQDMVLNTVSPMMAAGTIERKAAEGAVKELPSAMSHLAKYFKKSEIIKARAAKEEAQRIIREQASIPHPLAGIKEEIPFQHGSPNSFTQPSLDHLGAGAGDQWQGWGLYKAGLEDVAKRYHDMTAKTVRDSPTLFGVNLDNDALTSLFDKLLSDKRQNFNSGFLDGLRNPKRFRASKDYSIDDLRKLLRSNLEDISQTKENPYYQNITKKLRELKDKSPDAYNNFKDYMKKTSSRDATDAELDNAARSYKWGLNILQRTHPSEAQYFRDARVAMDDFGLDMKTARNKIDRLSEALSDRVSPFKSDLKPPMPAERIGNLYSGNIYANPDELFSLDKAINNQPASGRLGDFLQELWRKADFGPMSPTHDRTLSKLEEAINSGGNTNYTTIQPILQHGIPGVTPEDIAMMMKKRGIVGNQYLNQGSREMDPYGPVTSKNLNYVLHDLSRIKLTDLKGILAALGLGAGATAVNNSSTPTTNKGNLKQ
jgi:hypothetical protein